MNGAVMDLEAFQATRRAHVADQVFDQLATAILKGELPAGTPLPAERVLADRFGTSRIIVRQAIHRLDDVGLVRVRQGGATVVRDPDDAGDLRVLELFYRLLPSAPGAGIEPRDMVEKQFLQGMALIDVARRRGSLDELRRILEMTTTFADGPLDEAGYLAFEERFWRAVARAGKNRILAMEVAWWYRVLTTRPRAEHLAPTPLASRVEFYRQLARRLAGKGDPVRYYRDAVRPILDALTAPSRASAAQSSEPRGRTARKRVSR